ncbi:hypothetical protein JXB27_03605 [Candidatus Woesearchaeota archaeon]|nr:hypothetical protein [Candidatus Woesearchaeota archaeon]
MVSKAEKRQMVSYVVHQLEESSLYAVENVEEDRVIVSTKTAVIPQKIKVLAIHSKIGRKELEAHQNQAIRDRELVAPIFYKDGKDFFVLLADVEAMRSEKSLKKYSPHEIHQMTSLRGLEKDVFDFTKPTLTYYQPKTERLEEGVRTFDMNEVHLDYSHLRPGDQGYDFARNGGSEKYKLPAEIQATIDSKLIIEPTRGSFARIKKQ